MKRIIIEGGRPLSGTIKIGGAKNSVVALISACLLADGVVKLTNVPNISDRDALTLIMDLLGAKVINKGGELIVDSSNVENIFSYVWLFSFLLASTESVNLIE